MSAALSHETLSAACERLHATGGGYLSLEILTVATIARLLDASVGCRRAETGKLLYAADDFLEGVRNGSTLCLCCPRVLNFGNVRAVALLYAACCEPREALAFGVCAGCAGGRSERDLASRALKVLRRIWPDLRELGPAGHA